MKAIFTSVRWTMMLCAFFFSLQNSFATDTNCEEVVFSLYCPDDVTVSCDAELWDLDIYGNATYHDYTGWHDAGDPVEHWNLNSCNAGTITRTWTVEDYNWNIHSCTQTITVSGGSTAFDYHSINWPDDIELEGCNPPTHPSQLPTESSWPTYDYAECTSIAVSYEDHVYTVNNACRKIIREWKVMDWCQYQPGYGWGNGGMWTYNQKIKIIGGEVPEITCESEVTASSYNCIDARVDVDPVYVEGDACGDHYTVTNNSPYADSNGADISGRYPIGTTMVKYTVQYGCGKRKQCTTKVVVEDKKGPTVYCYGEITIALMPVDEDGDGIPEDGMAEIWAKDLDKGSFPNCNGHSLTFSFSPDVLDMSKTFTCDNVGDNEVRMYVTDYHGRQTYCIVNVKVQNNGANIPDCEPTVDDDDDDDDGSDTDSLYHGYTIAGSVLPSMDNSMFEGGVVELTNMAPVVEYITTIDTTITSVVDSFINHSGATLWYTVYDSTFTTTVDSVITHEVHEYELYGTDYVFESMVDSTDELTLRASVFQENRYDGIDRNDLDYMLSVILGTVKLETVAQFIAADIDQNGKVNFDDLKIMLEYLSDVDHEVLSLRWEVLDAETAKLAAEKHEGALDKKTTILVDHSDHMDMNFVAVKIGDLTPEKAPLVAQVPLDDVRSVLETSSSVQEVEVKLRSMTQSITNSVAVSPNPFADAVSFDYTDDTAGVAVFEIVDVAGKVRYRQSIQTLAGSNVVTVDLSDQEVKGLLVYRIIDGDTVYTGKILRL